MAQQPHRFLPVNFSIANKSGYLHAELRGRETAEDMRAFLLAVKAACGEHLCPRILLSIRDSRPVFKLEDYGLSGEAPGYVAEIVTPACRIALIGDTSELHFAHEYIELVARQQQVNVKSFREPSSAVRWLQAAEEAGASEAGAKRQQSGAA